MRYYPARRVHNEFEPYVHEALLAAALVGTSEAATRRFQGEAEALVGELAGLIVEFQGVVTEAEKARDEADESAAEARKELDTYEDRMAEISLEDVALAALLVKALGELLRLVPYPPPRYPNLSKEARFYAVHPKNTRPKGKPSR